MHVLTQSVFTAIIGSPGAGKSSMGAWIARMALAKGIPVWCNYHIAGVRVLDIKKIVTTDTSGSVVIIDEVGGAFNSRNFKAFTQDLYNYFATARHRKTQIFLLVQAWDRMDLALRELCNTVLLVKKSLIFPHTTVVQTYSAKLDLVKDANGNAKEFVSIFTKKFTRWHLRLKDYKAFDSFQDFHKFDNEPIRHFPVSEKLNKVYPQI